MQQCMMEQQLETFVEKLSTLQEQKKTDIPKFEESILSTSENGILPIAAGLALSGFIGGLVNRFMPLGNLALPVGGFLMMKFFKSGFLHSMGKGVLAAGLAALFGGLGSGLGGILAGAGAGGNSQVVW